MPANSGIPGFLRENQAAIMQAWIGRLTAEPQDVALDEPVMINDVPQLLDELATWLATDDPPDDSLLASHALGHAIQRLDSGVALGQLLREYRLLREVMLADVLTAEAVAQAEPDPSGPERRRARVVELARLNAGLDVVLSHSVEHFVATRDRRAAAVADAINGRLQKVMNVEGVGVLTFSEDGSLLDANEAFLQMLGYSHADVTSRSMTWRDLTPPEYVAESERQMCRLAQTGRIGPYQKEYFCKDGRRLWMLFAGAALGDGTIVEYCIDISSQRRSEVRYRTLFESIEQGFAIVEVLPDEPGRCPDARFLEVNPAFERQTGLALAAGRTVREVAPDLDAIRPETFARVASSGQREHFTAFWEPRSRWFEVDVCRVGEQSERRVALLLSDITERLQAERRQQQADRRKDEFLAVLGHELRNPLAPIRTGLGLLEHARANPALLDSLGPMLQRQVAHLTRLVDDLLDMARVNRGAIGLRRTPLNLNHSVEAALEQARNLVAERGHSVRVELAAEPLPVDGDFERLTQVVANLLSNAAKYTRPGGSITVTTALAGDRAIIRIRDSGYGIPPERLGEVFEMFAQVPEHRELDGGSGGLGIGLALARQIIEMHGGEIEARSEGIGRGSEFIVRLPVCRSVPASGGPKDLMPHAAAHRRVLVVDDNVDAAESLAMLLRLEGHAVEVAHDGTRAVQLFERFHPETVLLDIGLPGWDGIEVARRMRALAAGQAVQLVAVTGWGQDRARRRTRDAGFDHHLTKPVDPDELLDLFGQSTAGTPSAATRGVGGRAH